MLTSTARRRTMTVMMKSGFIEARRNARAGKWTQKKTYRLYDEAGPIRRQKRKAIGPFKRKLLPPSTAINQSGSIDFVAHKMADGRRMRCLAVVDDYSRECLAIEVNTSITGTRVG